MNPTKLKEQVERCWAGHAQCTVDTGTATTEIECLWGVLADVCRRIVEEWDFSFAGLIVEEDVIEWQLRYAFYGEGDAGWVHVLVRAPLAENFFPSLVEWIHAVDWHEREAEDLFGLHFQGHPRLGDFVLHDDAWQEGVEPMRRGFDAEAAMRNRLPDADWRPTRIVQEPGAFVMPIGPKFSGVTESVHFLLETVGEDVIRSSTRLFYKWRAIEKLAEGKPVEEVLLLAERFAATTAFAHGLAFCQAVESISGAEVPARARALRVFLAELERLRQHAGAIQEICESTALVVATSQAGLLEEDLLRVSGELTGHRYLFGLLAPGGLLCDLPTDACRAALIHSQDVLRKLMELERRLSISSSFLDRIEEVGVISAETAKAYSLVGPVARASGLARDLRRAQPYSGYQVFNFDVPTEQEGDGYARLRVLFAEARQSVRIMQQVAVALQEGSVCRPVHFRPGAALGSVEAPRGGTFHWVRLNEGGQITRYRVITPSFANWHSFHLAAEKFAFQDFPIILSTFDLSVAENDR
ncbi:MAG TPA: NADH-quinone oxidoreductase subunit C [Candidatus Acidoferrales bacterium]|nr:NADH-quinone oxidoreductase subunit C [Candidatus Acidoferrales bacterium]